MEKDCEVAEKKNILKTMEREHDGITKMFKDT